MKVLRLCSVFEPPQHADLGGGQWDPVGGMQFHTGQLSRGLARLGIDQTVVTAYVPGGPRLERPTERITVHRMGWAVPFWRQLYAAPAAVTLLRAVRRHDLLHAHLGEDLAVLPLALGAARFAAVPLVLTIHCSMRRTLTVTDFRSTVLHVVGGWFEDQASRRAAATITLTDQLGRALVADGLEPDRVFTIPSGFDPRLFAGTVADPFPQRPRPRVVYVGRLTAQKGVHTLLAALPQIAMAKDILIVGDGPMRSQLEAMAADLGGERVRFTGFVPHETVAAILGHTDVLVLPSVYEELGSILVEGMAAGAPIVASGVGGIPELLENGRAGILVRPQDPMGLATAIDRVLSDTALATDLQAAGRRRAAALSWDSLAQRVLEVYRQALGGADGARSR